MPYCNDCGEHVTHRFVRVYGKNGEVDGCRGCSILSERSKGESVPEEYIKNDDDSTNIQW